jgi:MFS superfamily sulfate permease-like transporter
MGFRKNRLPGNQGFITQDAVSGFLVFLLALPLSLGIARASDFPPVMGLITAMIGGLFVSLLAGAPLTIKGPAAGLIVIVAGAVAELGQGDAQLGWKYALGAVVVAGFIQILFGLIRLGSLVDFFPLSAVHGMLAAIGISIISKQSHILLGMNPVNEAGESLTSPFELVAALPQSLASLFGPVGTGNTAALLGLSSLLIVLIWPRLKSPILRKIPAPVMVLLVAIPLGKLLKLDRTQLVHFDQSLSDILAVNVDFGGMSQTGVFLKFVLMFALVGSLESLLTVKAIDQIDPLHRKSKTNLDLMAVGAGNMLAGIFGGLPMISEVARSSANVHNGAKTRWANFFHGLFIMCFLLLDLQFNDLIPIPALAAMLIGVGIKLASPREFGRMANIGREQLTVFCVTILATLASDLLIGIGAGIVTKLITQYFLGAPLRSMFKAHTIRKGNTLKVAGAAVFSNWLGIRRNLDQIPPQTQACIDFSACNLVDFTVINNLHHLQAAFTHAGGSLSILGLDEFQNATRGIHAHATRNKPKKKRKNLDDAVIQMSQE